MARILVIDDDRSLLKMMKLMMERAGHDAILATNGREGIQAAIEEKPDLAIVDVMMPELSGYDVCRQLRENATTQDIPLLILTARAQPMDRQMAADAGADDFVTKPVTRDDLIEHLSRLLESGPVNVPTPAFDDTPFVQQGGNGPAAGSGQITDIFSPPELQTQTQETPQPQPDRQTIRSVIAVMALHGGSGGTSVAVNLALGVMQHGRACLVDLGDVPGHVAVQLRMMPPAATWENLVGAGPAPDPKSIGASLMMHPSAGIAVMAAPTTSTAERLSSQALEHVFGVLSEGFKRIVVDLPSKLEPTSEAVLGMASHVVLVVSDDTAILETAHDKLQAIESLELAGRLHIVLNRTRPGGATFEEAQRALGHSIEFELPYEAGQTSATASGEPLVMSAPASAFSQTILQLAKLL